MDVRHIESEVDLKLSLLAGDPLTTDNLIVHPLSLDDVKKIGYANYTRFLSLLTVNREELAKKVEEAREKTIFELFMTANDEGLMAAFLYALSIFLKEDINNMVFDNNLGIVFGARDIEKPIEEYQILNKDNFDDFAQILRYQNCLVDANEEYVKPVILDEKARKILEKIQKGKQKVEEIKKKRNASEDDADFSDIISAVSTKSNTYNKTNIWDLTVYQLYDEYKRLEAISSYETNIIAMVHGAKVDNLKHWSSKL